MGGGQGEAPPHPPKHPASPPKEEYKREGGGGERILAIGCYDNTCK